MDVTPAPAAAHLLLRNATAEEFRTVAGWGPAPVWWGMAALRAGRLAALGAISWLEHPKDEMKRLLAWATLDCLEPVPPLLLCRVILKQLRHLAQLGELAVYTHDDPRSEGKLLRRFGFQPCAELPGTPDFGPILVCDLTTIGLQRHRAESARPHPAGAEVLKCQ